jgi:phosphoribosylglycinamide formyltransferase-1
MRDHFVCESIKPVINSIDLFGMARGEPGLPQRFTWRGKEYSVGEVLDQWRETSGCTHGSGEKYVRKHWYKVLTTDGSEMTIYFERQARGGSSPKSRWWLFKILSSGN